MKMISFFLVWCGLVWGATFQDSQGRIEFQYDDKNWEVVPNGTANKPLEAVDKAMAERTVVTVQRKIADEKYRARFSIVIDPAEKFTGSETERLVKYQKHAVDFMKGQRFQIIDTRKADLPLVKQPAFEVLANHRDFGLYFRQIAFLKGNDAFLLTAAARTDKFPLYQSEIGQMFSTLKVLK